jgi:hypothetical protein
MHCVLFFYPALYQLTALLLPSVQTWHLVELQHFYERCINSALTKAETGVLRSEDSINPGITATDNWKSKLTCNQWLHIDLA